MGANGATAAALAAPQILQRIGMDFVSPMQLGAVGDGSTDDTAAFTACNATGKAIVLQSGKTYKLNGFVLDNSKVMVGMGDTTIKVVGNTTAVTVGVDGYRISGIKFIGDGKASGYTSQIAIDNYKPLATYGSMQGIVSDCVFTDIGGKSVFYTYTAPSGNQSGNLVSRCVFESCYMGAASGTRGEAVTVSDCTMHSCTYGAQTAAGNCVYKACKFVNCTDGLNVIGGTNDSHGMAIGCSFLHCTYPIDINGITNGFIFDGCSVYQGTVNLVNTVGVQFSNGLLDADAFSFDGSLGTIIKNNVMPYGYANTVSNNVNSHQSRTLWIDNHDMTGKARPQGLSYTISGGYARSDYVGGSAQNIASGATDVLKPGVLTYNYTSGNTAYTADTFYDTSTGAYAVVGYGSGIVRVKFNVYLTGAGSLGSSYMGIRINGTAVEFLFPSFGNSLWYFLYNGSIRATAGQTIDFILGNNSGNTITIPATSDSWFELDGL